MASNPKPDSNNNESMYNNGRGDSQHYTKKAAGGYWKLKKLADGSRTPVFIDGSPKAKEKLLKWQYEDDHDEVHETPILTRVEGRTSLFAAAPNEKEDYPEIQTRLKVPLKATAQQFDPDDIIHCPLCYEPMIEATTSACGHVFCYECVHAWMKLRGWCPICQASLTSWTGVPQLHRVYAIDNVVEHHLEQLGAETKRRFLARRRIRLDAYMKEYKANGWVKYFRELGDRLRLYRSSKGIARGIGRVPISVWKNYCPEVPGPTLFVIMAPMLAYILGTYHSSVAHFLAYVWNYPYGFPSPSPVPPRPRLDVDNVEKYFNLFKWLYEVIWGYIDRVHARSLTKLV